MQILFVCRGNVGRSQMAEAILHKRAPSLTVKSAGTHVFNKDGNSAEGERLKDREGAKAVIEVLRELDIDAHELERNQITEKMVEDADVIVSMAEKETLPEYLKNNIKVRFWDIEDPKERTVEATREIRENIERHCAVLAAELGV